MAGCSVGTAVEEVEVQRTAAVGLLAQLPGTWTLLMICSMAVASDGDAGRLVAQIPWGCRRSPFRRRVRRLGSRSVSDTLGPYEG